jgi:two-component system, LuxR family, response regulator FixJ
MMTSVGPRIDQPDSSSDFPPPTVYLIEDDESQRTALEMIVAARGFQTAAFASSEAFMSAWSRDDAPGCIVLDFLLHGRDGLSFLKLHRERYDAMPVIVITGHADVSVAVQFMRAGAATLLLKPYEPDELLLHIDQAIAWDQQSLTNRRQSETVQALERTISYRQHQILDMILSGDANKVIAAQLGVSERTIELERAELFRLFNVRNAVELAVLVTESRAFSRRQELMESSTLDDLDAEVKQPHFAVRERENRKETT